MREKLLDLVLPNGDLPPLSQILKKLVELAKDPDADVNSVVNLVEKEFFSLASKAIFTNPFSEEWDEIKKHFKF